MKLVVLGGSAAGGNTGQGCSGYYLEVGGTRLVLDLGPGTLLELRRHTDYRTLDAVVASHLHLDHVLDIPSLQFALAYNPIRPPGPVPLWLPPGGAALLSGAAQAFGEVRDIDSFLRVFEIREYDPSRPLEIGDARLTFTPTVHYIPCWAIRVAGPGDEKALVYTADTGPAADLGGFVAGAGVLLAEATLLEPSAEPYDSRGHLTAGEAAQMARDADAETLVLTHMWEEYGFDEYRARAAAIFDGRVELARPGLTVEW